MKSRIQHGQAVRSRRRQRHSQWVVASGVTLCSALAASSALAQTAPAPASAASAAAPTKLDEVVVTVRKRAERLQDVPLSITAITAKQLEDSGAKNLLDIAKLTPGLTINSAGSEANINITIRGLADLSGGANDPNVAVFIDGVYQANRSAISLGLMDLERIEVIKGPVSALYGRNAYAGVINYVTKKPSDIFEASVTLGAASDRGATAKASIGGPIQKGVLDYRLTVAHDESAGSYKDSVTGLRAGGYKKNDGALSVSLTPTRELSVVTSVYYGDDFFGAQAIAYMDNNCGPINRTGVNASVNGGAGAFTQNCGELNPKQHPVEVAAISPNAGQAGNKRRVQADTLRVGYDFGVVDASALVGYNKVIDQRYADFTGHRDGIPFITAPNPPGTIYNLKELFGSDANNADKSLELRVATKQNQALRGSGGMYWFNATSTATTLIGADGSPLPPGTTLPAGSTGSLFLTSDGSFSKSNFTLTNFTDKIVSPFAAVEYDVIPALTLQAEARHTKETKSYDIVRNAFIANTDHPYGAAGTGSVDYSFSNYRGSARYKVDGDSMVYVSAANGTKAGGINQRATTVAELKFDPETSTTVEIGGKASFLDRKVQLSIALYHQKSKDVQISGPSDDPRNVGLVTKNLASTKSTGIDFDFAVVPLRGLTLNGGVGYADPKITSGSYDFSNAANCLTIASCAPRVTTVQTLQGPRQVVDLNGLQSPRASKVTFSAGAQYDGALVNGLDWFGRVDFRYESKQYTAPIGFNFIGARKVVNLNAGVIGDKFKVTTYVRNLTNDKTPDSATPNGLINGGVTPWVAYLPAQRTYGVTATYDF
jgi:iron complex outermembrane receptor protein